MIKEFLQYVKETYGQRLFIDKNRSESFEDLFKISVKQTKKSPLYNVNPKELPTKKTKFKYRRK